MAKAKNKTQESKSIVVADFSQRMKNFEADLIKLIQLHQVGLRPEIAADRTKIQATMVYIDLIEMKKQQDEANNANKTE